MLSNCIAKCIAKTKIKPHLWLRNGVFYYKIELAKVEGKRRYFCYSLYTNNYYEALAKMVEINDFNAKFDKLCELYSEIKIEVIEYKRASLPSGHYGMILNIPAELILSGNNNPQTLIDFVQLFGEVNQNIEKYNIQKEMSDKLKSMEDKLKLIEKTLGPDLLKKITGTSLLSKPEHTLQYMLDSMLLKANNGDAETTRKRHFFEGVFKDLDLSLEDDYSKFHNADNIQKITKDVLAQKNVKNDNKRQKLRYVKEFVNFACDLEPDFYKNNILVSIPNLEKTKRSERQPHLPYSNEQLKKIFNPKEDFFKNEPDMFWICMIALFSGARRNAATTLQYGDIIMKDGMSCIEFKENHKIKHLKNEASERIVPIHKQLLDMGFVDYITLKKIKEGKRDEDFILSKILTKSGEYNNKHLDRYLFEFFKEIGVKDKGYDFHSFRKNASLALQTAGLIPTIINAIIGWEGKGTMEQSYSNYDLKQIKAEYEKFSYTFLQPEFDEWKKIMSKKP